MHLPEALHFEKAAAIESARQISASTIATRREGVINRGREQTQQAGREE
jgi:hypothetical protein